MNSFNSEKLAFYKWIYKWVSADNGSIQESPVDIPQIAAVLQAVGYKLKTVDYSLIDKKPTDSTTIELRCNKSGMRAILSKELNNCFCPNSKTANEGQFWSVSGMGPSCSQDNLNCIEETYSNLIPEISKDKTVLIKDILTKLFAIISDTDMNSNDERRKYNTRRSRSDLTRITRQNTYEIDFEITPPKSSSPLPTLSKSASRLSLNDDKEQILTELLLTVRENLDKALTILPNKSNCTFTKLNEKLLTDIENDCKSDFNKVIKKLNSTPKKSLSKPKLNNKSTENNRMLSKFGTFTKRTETSPFIKKDTPRPDIKKLVAPVASNIPDRRLSLGSIPRRSSFKSNLNLSGGSDGKCKSNIPAMKLNFSPTLNKKTDYNSSFRKPDTNLLFKKPETNLLFRKPK